MQTVHARVQIVHLDIGEAPGAIARNEVGVTVDCLAGKLAATGGSQRHHSALRIVGRTVEHLELDCLHEVADIGQRQRIAQVGFIATVQAQALIPREHRKRLELNLQKFAEQALQHALGEIHDVLLADE